MISNLNELFKNLSKNYDGMDEKSKEEFIKLIKNIDELAKSDQDIKSLNKTIERKLKGKRIYKEKRYDLEHLRNYVIHRMYYQNEEDIFEFSNLIWDVLPHLKYFIDIKELNNFLAYIMQVDINISYMAIQDKKKLVKVYQDIFMLKNKKEQKEILVELSKIIVAEVSRKEVKEMDMVLHEK